MPDQEKHDAHPVASSAAASPVSGQDTAAHDGGTPSEASLSDVAHLVAPGPAGRLLGLVHPVLLDLGFALVRIKITGDEEGSIVQVMAERTDGTLTIEDCEQISYALSALFDVEDPIAGGYALEVSSPGVARPLTRAKDFVDFAGYEAKIELQAMVDGRRRFRGVLAGFEDGEILIETLVAGFDSPQILGFKLGDIDEAHLVVSEEMLKSALKGVKPAGRARN